MLKKKQIGTHELSNFEESRYATQDQKSANENIRNKYFIILQQK